MIRALLGALATLLLLVLTGCGGGGGGGGSSDLPTSLQIVGGAATVARGGVALFSVAKTGGNGGTARWSVVPPGGGTISSDGRYTAPNTDGVYTIRVTLAERESLSATRTVMVGAGDFATGITLTPTTASLAPGGTQPFAAVKTGGSQGTVVFSVEPATGGGTIDVSGLYTAPATPGTYTVRARLIENALVTGTAAVTVVAPASVTITSPTDERVLSPGATLPFAATVGTGGTLFWTADGGTITAAGLYTAPTTPGTYTITATAGTAVATRSVRVVANPSVRLRIRYSGTTEGEVVLRLNTDLAPNTSANLVNLTNRGFYDGIVFHRYVAGFVIQGGDPLTKTLPLTDPSIGTGGPGYTIPFEANSLLHEKYVLAMARSTERDSGGSQWYVTLEPQPSLDGDYVVFGKVQSGFAIIDALRRGDTILSAKVEP